MTDIEGSTMLVHDLADRYLRLLDDVRSLIRSTVGDHDGYEVDSRADEYFAAFGRAEDAIGAAVEIQKRMSESTWPDDRRVRVRIGVHSGSPALTDTGYVGMPVNVMARVCAAGHGGQILMTAATRDELAHWPRDIDAVSLGVFEIRGLPEPEELLQVRGPGLSDDFPRLRVGHSDSQD
jgi:class 3 adenylate cyclase